MDQQSARILLGVSLDEELNEEDLQDNYEEEVFKITSFFLNRMFIPKLALAKVKRLDSLIEANAVLSDVLPEQLKDKIEIPDFSSCISIEELVSKQQESEMAIKLGLANAKDAMDGRFQLLTWHKMFVAYAEKYLRLFPDSEKEFVTEPPQLSSYLEYGELLQEVREGDYMGWASKEYARLKKLMS